MKVLHVITDLTRGGAERMLEKLCAEAARTGATTQMVVSLRSMGDMGALIEAQGAEVRALGLSGPFSTLRAVWRLRAIIREFCPDIVQTWLYLADIIGAVVARSAGYNIIVWNLRCMQSGGSRMTRMLVRINAAFSSWLPRSIISCGEEVMRFHIAQGYDPSRIVVIPNGFDVEYFTPPSPRSISQQTRFVAIGRADVLKDYQNLLAATALAVARAPGIRLTIHGRGVTRDRTIMSAIRDNDLAGIVSLHEQADDVRPLMGEADGYCQSSVSEGFPNVLGEAMLMELPCVTTAAGESATIVGQCGLVVPVRDSAALAGAMAEIAQMPQAERLAMGSQARWRIANHYSIGAVFKLYLDHYRTLLSQ